MSENTISEKVQNLVDMDDGTVENFGTRTTLKTSMDVKKSSITFKTVTGNIIPWVVEGIESFTEIQKIIYLYGLLEKIKASVAGSKTLSEDINKHIESIKGGEFSIRAIGRAVSNSLTLEMKAFALAKAEAQPEFEHLQNLEDPEVLSEVLGMWNGFTSAEKRSKRSNPYVQYHLAELKRQENPDMGADI